MTVPPSALPPSPLSIPHVHTQTNTLARILTGMQVATCYSYSVPSSVSTSCPDQFLSMWSQGVCADMTVQVGTEWVAVVSGPCPYLFSQNTHASTHWPYTHASLSHCVCPHLHATPVYVSVSPSPAPEGLFMWVYCCRTNLRTLVESVPKLTLLSWLLSNLTYLF